MCSQMLDFVSNLILTTSNLTEYLPSIAQIFIIWKLVIKFDQAEFQNQVLVVHVSVISASISREPKQ